ncbi:hypothetical protein KI387_007896, partial [Taxus chinensis]
MLSIGDEYDDENFMLSIGDEYDDENFTLYKVEDETNELKNEKKEVFDTKNDQLEIKEKEKLAAILGDSISYKSKVPSKLK